jgi:hypothetical protein
MSVNTRASKAECTRPLPADSLIEDPIGSFTRAVTIAASPDTVWPWLLQMGGGRAGWYSYDHIDNGGEPSAWRILPEHQSVRVGDIFPALPGAEEAFVVSALTPDRELLLTVPLSDGEVMVTWEFVLDALASGHTRLLVRGRVAPGWPGRPSGSRMIERAYRVLSLVPRPFMLAAAGLGHGIMEAKMLRGIKRRAERTGHAAESGPGVAR